MSDKFMQSLEDENKKYPKDKKDKSTNEIFLTFRYNRTFELHIGRNLYRFEGRKTIKVPSSVLNHIDWTDNISKNFIIQEV